MWGGVTPFLKVEAEGGVSSPQKYKVRGNLPKGKGVFFICFEILLSGKGLGVKKNRPHFPHKTKRQRSRNRIAEHKKTIRSRNLSSWATSSVRSLS